MQQVSFGPAYLALMQPGQPDFVCVEGPRGTGKTRAILSVLMSYALGNPGARILLARSTRTRLTESVLVTLEDQVFPAFNLPIPGGSGRKDRHDYRLFNGSSFVTMGLDDLNRSTSAEYAKIYVSEGVEIPDLDTVSSLAGSIRQAKYPERQLIVDFNPGPPGHWANQHAEPVPDFLRRIITRQDYARLHAHNMRRDVPAGKWKRIITTHKDNPAYWDGNAWDWTDEGRAYLKTLENLKGHIRARWLEGRWCAAAGGVFAAEFEEERNICAPFPIPPEWPQWVYVDPGYDHPCAILWLAIGFNGTVYICNELYRGGKRVSEHAADISTNNAGRNVQGYYLDPRHGFSRTAQSPETIAEQFERCGLQFDPWTRQEGDQAQSTVNLIREALVAGRLKVFRTCPNTISEFQSWSYRRTASGELPPGDDAFEDRNNHAIDCVRGFMLGGHRFAPGTIEVGEAN